MTCITDPPPSSFATPLSTNDPPFVVSGTTDKPFLAKVKLSWAGNQNPPMEIEHWVELDPYHTAVNPVLGDEQILDVELDRHTELLPIRSGTKAQTKFNNTVSHVDVRSGSKAHDHSNEYEDPSKYASLSYMLSVLTT